MYDSTSGSHTSRSPCEELSGPRRGPSEIGSSTRTRNPMADWQMREKRPLRGPRPEPPGPALKNYITPAGLQRLKDEHLFLLSRERPAVVEVVAWAASNGDRSENADYLYGKRRLGQIDSRIRFLTKRIDAAVVVDPAAPAGGSRYARLLRRNRDLQGRRRPRTRRLDRRHRRGGPRPRLHQLALACRQCADEGEPRRPREPACASKDGTSRDHRGRVRADSDGSFPRTARSSVDAQGRTLLDQAARL